VPFDPLRRHRRSIRLPAHDYRTPGAYFVTIVSAQRECVFDDPVLRALVERLWLAIPHHCSAVRLEAWVLMPNHLHGVICITDPLDRALQPLHGARLAAGSLGAIIGTFKSVTTRRINRIRRTPALPVWQRNYYERVVRDEPELDRIRAYIAANPLRWALDRENPNRIGKRDEWNADEDAWFGLSPLP